LNGVRPILVSKIVKKQKSKKPSPGGRARNWARVGGRDSGEGGGYEGPSVPSGFGKDQKMSFTYRIKTLGK